MKRLLLPGFLVALTATGCMLPIPHREHAASDLRPETAVRVTFPARDLVAVRNNGDTLRLRSVYEIYGQVVAASSTDVLMEVSRARHVRGVVHAPLGTRVTIPVEEGVQYVALTASSGFVEVMSFVVPVVIAYWLLERAFGGAT